MACRARRTAQTSAAPSATPAVAPAAPPAPGVPPPGTEGSNMSHYADDCTNVIQYDPHDLCNILSRPPMLASPGRHLHRRRQPTVHCGPLLARSRTRLRTPPVGRTCRSFENKGENWSIVMVATSHDAPPPPPVPRQAAATATFGGSPGMSLRVCPGRKQPFWAAKCPAHPCKNATGRIFIIESAEGA
jgi:hypothetical protein